MIDHDEARRLFEASLDHLKQEAAANSNEARAAAQVATLTVIRDCMARAGWSGMFDRRMTTFVRGRDEGSPADGGDLGRLVKGNPRNARRAIARFVQDMRPIPEIENSRSIWSLVLAESGRDGAHGDGGVWDREKVSGVKRDTAPQFTLKHHLVDRLGYTSGAEGRPEKRRVPELLLARAIRYWNAMRNAATGERAEPVTAATIRDWCTAGGPFADLFDSGYRRGVADRAAKRVDRSKKLPGG
jgi:hypothetical protein